MSVFTPSPRLMQAVEAEVRGRGFRLKHLIRGITRLSERFNRAHGPLGEYLLMPEALASYTAYYLPVNALKVRWILEEMTAYAPDFLKTPRRVLDFGSGPGTALLGLAEISGLPHDAVAVDRVPPALEMAGRLLRALSPMNLEATTVPPEGPFDLIFAVNVYSELDGDDGIRSLLDRLDPEGYLVLVEPALKPATRRVMTLRDTLAAEGWTVAAPCLDVPACPMLPRKDLWCHLEIPWTRPAWIQRLDDRTGLDKERLKFSYLVLTKNGARLTGSARVVTHVRKEKGKVWTMLCGGGATLCRAELLKRDTNPDNRAFKHARRGDVLRIERYEGGERTRIAADAKVDPVWNLKTRS